MKLLDPLGKAFLYIAKDPMRDSHTNSPEHHSRRSKIKVLTTFGVRGSVISVTFKVSGIDYFTP
jgi:hypothetical protein